MSGLPDATGTTIVDGTQTVTMSLLTGQVLSQLASSIAPGRDEIEISSDSYSYTDNLNLSYMVTHLDTTTESVQYGCCGMQSSTDRDGVTATYVYDANKRQVGSLRNGITSSNILDAAGNVLATIRAGTDGRPSPPAWRPMTPPGNSSAKPTPWVDAPYIRRPQTPAARPLRPSPTPTAARASKPIIRTAPCSPSPARRFLQSTTSTGVESDGGVQRAYTEEIKQDASGNDTSEWTKSYTDMLGRGYKTLYSDGASSTSFYNGLGQLLQQAALDRTNLYAYNTKGELEYTVIDMNGDGIINSNGTDRITRTVSDVVYDSQLGNVRRTLTYVWTNNNQDSPLCISTNETSVDGSQSWQMVNGFTTYSQTTYNSTYEQRTVTVTDRTTPSPPAPIRMVDCNRLPARTRTPIRSPRSTTAMIPMAARIRAPTPATAPRPITSTTPIRSAALSSPAR